MGEMVEDDPGPALERKIGDFRMTVCQSFEPHHVTRLALGIGHFRLIVGLPAVFPVAIGTGQIVPGPVGDAQTQKIPQNIGRTGFVAVLLGTILAWSLGLAPVGERPEGVGLHLPVPVIGDLVEALTGGYALTYISIIIPIKQVRIAIPI